MWSGAFAASSRDAVEWIMDLVVPCLCTQLLTHRAQVPVLVRQSEEDGTSLLVPFTSRRRSPPLRRISSTASSKVFRALTGKTYPGSNRDAHG